MAERPVGSEIEAAYDGLTAAVLLLCRMARQWWRERKERR